MPDRRDRQFAAKVHCFNTGYEKVKGIEFEVIANLDADISFDDDYFEFLLKRFADNSDLGVAGTPFIENKYSSVDSSFEGEKHVAGGVQLFRIDVSSMSEGIFPIKAGESTGSP